MKKIIQKLFIQLIEPIWSKILTSFSIYTNTIKLFTVNNSKDQLPCLDAIRFLSMAWFD
jgi:hypothetical protein